ncbi:F-box domain-containing protein [Rasamsonia emersonii CBS 393.64]|uniref:F-box domain-containing protein n=1 Tax=Rasamsonia emersonii (strain ATCC 16479 / CBS 393.64 / IMI 116815) TaxID=1408163 RepID=A0A0F4Z1S5_RASE3|nr:F-box domain-containing protein [Rasamsonia emersonii CBS 393.64]KKA23813.1 F-box domain-containing protein [Rasamsonia emersonii CBS 393.64]
MPCCERLERHPCLSPVKTMKDIANYSSRDWREISLAITSATRALICIRGKKLVLQVQLSSRGHACVAGIEMLGQASGGLAMKRHYYGPGHGPSTESLSFTEVQASDEATTLLSVEARICPAPASLCLRIQQWVVMSSVKADTILSKTPSTLICGHIGSGHTVVSRIVESRSPEIFKCRYCNIDYQLEIKEYPDDRSALVITKWLDLGSGLTPNDPRWRVHIGMGRHAELGASSEAGDVRRRFENGQGLSQDALSCQNESYVMTPNDRSGILDCWGKDIWIQQAGKRLTQSSDEPYTTLLRKMCKVILFLFLCFAYPKLILWWVVLLSRL